MNLNRKLFGIRFVALAAAIIALMCAAGPWAASTRAQGSRKDDVVFNSRGTPLAGAQVRVCAANATTTSPCTPLAQIFSNAALTQALANPLVTDGMGNYVFYAAPGRYVIEVSGPGITTRQMRDVILPNDPASPTFTSLTTTSNISAFTLSLAGNLTVAGSAAVTGSLTVGGAPVPSTSQANTWTANQTFGANALFKGPAPHVDITAFDPPNVDCTGLQFTTGNISSGSHALTLASAIDFHNGCQVMIPGAGPTSSLAAPVAVSAAWSPQALIIADSNTAQTKGIVRAANVVTVTVLGYTQLAVGDSVTIAGVAGCGTNPNGTFTVAATPALNQFTIASSGANESCGGGTATPSAGTTSYTYTAVACDTMWGCSAPSGGVTVTTSAAALSGSKSNSATFDCVTGANAYIVYRGTQNIGMFPPCLYTRVTFTVKDYGIAAPNNQVPLAAPVTLPSGATAQMLETTISGGAGTTSIFLAAAASNTVSGAGVYHDESASFQAAINFLSGLGAGGKIVTPAGKNIRFNGSSWTLPSPGPNGAQIILQIDGLWFPFNTINLSNQHYAIHGYGGSAPQASFQREPLSTISPGALSPVIFANGGQANIEGISIVGFNDSSQSTGLFGTALLSVNVSDEIRGFTFGHGQTQCYSDVVIYDGASGVGGLFGENFADGVLSSMCAYPVHTASFNNTGSTTFHDLFLGGRSILEFVSGGISGGGVYFNGEIISEALIDPALLEVDFSNGSNLTGIKLDSPYGMADNLFGDNYTVYNLTTGPNNSGMLTVENILGGQSGQVGGTCFQSALFVNTGNAAVPGGVQQANKCDYTMQTAGAREDDGGRNIMGTLGVNLPTGTRTNSNDASLHLIDRVNGGNGISVTTLSPIPFARLDTTASDAAFTMESANTGQLRLAWCRPNAGSPSCPGQIYYNHSADAFGVNAGSNTQMYIGDSLGGVSIRRGFQFLNSGSNPLTFGGSFTSPRSQSFQDASGTIALTSQLPLAGTTAGIGGGSLAAGACTTGTASVASSTTSMAVAASPSADPGTGFTWGAWVSSAGTVTVRVCNVSGATATPAATAYNVRVIQ